jgi:type IV secretory pathway VirB10-like protein
MNRNQKIIIAVAVLLVFCVIVVSLFLAKKKQVQKDAAAQRNVIQKMTGEIPGKKSQPVDQEAAKKNEQFIKNFNARSK